MTRESSLSIQSIAEHSYLVAQLAPVVYAEFRTMFKDPNVPLLSLMLYGHIHDTPEAITGDSAPIDKMPRADKHSAEAAAIQQIYGGLEIFEEIKKEFDRYEARVDYATQIVKMHDALELVLYTQLCVRNGVGLLTMVADTDRPEYRIILDSGEKQPIDPRTYEEISEYFNPDGTVKLDGAVVKHESPYILPVSRIMYDHGLAWLQNAFGADALELVEVYQIVSAEAAVFPFEEYNLANLKPVFAP
ncbi:HD domain-containing protein [Candidatus Saccharibacteria bacterium]|nr:HD domain-containing protein [Candidatus Saccharibacteria bacterium]